MTSQAPASDVAGHVGETFRRRREHFQVALESVANEIRIRPSFLAAIEEGRFSDLPGATYAAGFVRTYAEYLDLDPEEMVRRFKNESASLARSAPLRFPSPIADGTVPRAALLLLGAVIAAVGYGTWYVLSTRNTPVVERVAPVPDRLATTAVPPSPAPEPRTAPPATAVPPPATPSAPGASDAPPASLSPANPVTPPTSAAPGGEGTHAAAPPAPSVAPASGNAPAAPEEGAAPPNPAGRVVLRARADTWIEVRDPANKAVLIARVLRGGEEFVVPERAGLKLVTGNAGGLVVLVDGAPLPPLGKEGTVRKGIALEPEALRAAAVPAN